MRNASIDIYNRNEFHYGSCNPLMVLTLEPHKVMEDTKSAQQK